MRLLAALLAIVACTSAPPPTRCTPGASMACVCPGGATGAQVCEASGERHSPCACREDAGGDASITPRDDAPALDAVRADDRPAPGDGVAVCDANTLADPANCGACGRACPSPANATTDCAAGLCRFVCRTGFADCDREARNGCEVDRDADPMNCGQCGAPCAAGRVCALGRCRAP